MTIGGIEQRYAGYYFCPHKSMTLGFSISVSLVVLLLIVAVLRCVRVEKVKCKQKFEEEANERPVVVAANSCDQPGTRLHPAEIVE